MGGIFVSYRKMHDGVRRPHALTIAAIADRLRHHFGDDKVLVDMDLRAGDHYPSELRGWLAGADVVLVVVHREWLDDLKARKDEKWDWARWEAEEALRLGRHVVPVLLDDARLPGKETLLAEGFPALAELGTRQYWRLGFASWKQELAELLRVLEVRVATEELPPAQRKAAVRRRWFWLELAVAAAVGAIAPLLLVRLPVPGPPPVFHAALALALNLLMFIPFAIAVAQYAGRRWLDRQDQRFAETAHDTRTNAIVGATVAGLALIVLFSSRMLPDDAIVPALAVVAAVILVGGHQWLHNRGQDVWPYEDLVPAPTPVRAAIAHVGRFLTEHDLLTRAQRDQVEFVLGQVEWARQRMEELSRFGRLAWFRKSSILLLAAHVLLLGMILGAAAFAVAGGAASYYGLYLVIAVVAALVCYFGALEFVYRHQRWRLRLLMTTVPADVTRLRARLAEVSVPPAAPGLPC